MGASHGEEMVRRKSQIDNAFFSLLFLVNKLVYENLEMKVVN